MGYNKTIDMEDRSLRKFAKPTHAIFEFRLATYIKGKKKSTLWTEEKKIADILKD